MDASTFYPHHFDHIDHIEYVCSAYGYCDDDKTTNKTNANKKEKQTDEIKVTVDLFQTQLSLEL